MKAKTIDEKFDDGEEVLDAFDLSKATRLLCVPMCQPASIQSQYEIP